MSPTALDLLRAALVLLLAGAQALAAYWPEVTRAEHTITSRSAAVDTPVVPWGPFFAIWLLLFAASGAFAAWHALEGHRDPALATLGWIAAALFAGNVVWERWVPRRGLDRGSVAIIAGEVALALAALAVTVRWAPEGAGFWLGAVPLQLFAGWASVALLANLSSTLRGEGVEAPVPLLLAAVALVVLVSAWSGAVAYALAAAWGLAGIAAKAVVERKRGLAALAGAGAVAAAAVAA